MKKVLSFVLAGMMCFCLVSPAQAATYDVRDIDAVANKDSTTREFVRVYENYYTIGGGYQFVMEDPNYDVFDDRYVTISLQKGDGPTSLDVTLKTKKDGASKWESTQYGTIDVYGNAVAFTIKENYTFRIDAKATDGKDGNASIQVVLK